MVGSGDSEVRNNEWAKRRLVEYIRLNPGIAEDRIGEWWGSEGFDELEVDPYQDLLFDLVMDDILRWELPAFCKDELSEPLLYWLGDRPFNFRQRTWKEVLNFLSRDHYENI